MDYTTISSLKIVRMSDDRILTWDDSALITVTDKDKGYWRVRDDICQGRRNWW